MTAAQSAIFAPLYGLSAAQIPVALGQMSPLVYADALTVQRDAFHAASAVVGRELQARRGAPAAGRAVEAAGPHGMTIWMSGNGDFSRLRNGGDGTPGYHASVGGVVFGADLAPLPGGRIGLAAAFGSQSASTSGYGSFSGQSAQLMLYGSLERSGFFLDGQLGGMFEEGTARRPISSLGVSAKGDISGNGIGASIRGGRRFDLEGWYIEPSLTLRTLSVSNRTATETQGGPAGLRVNARSLASTQSELGVQIDRRFRIGQDYSATVSANLGWNYEMQDTNAHVVAAFAGLPDSAFVQRNAATSRSSAVAGIQARLDTGSPLSAFLGYDTRLADRYTAHNVTGGLRYTW